MTTKDTARLEDLFDKLDKIKSTLKWLRHKNSTDPATTNEEYIALEEAETAVNHVLNIVENRLLPE